VVPVSWRATIGIVFKSFLASIFDIFHICFYVCVCTRGGILYSLFLSPLSHTCKTYRVSNVVHCCRHAMPTSIHPVLYIFFSSPCYLIFPFWLLVPKVNLTEQHSIVNPSYGFSTKKCQPRLGGISFIAARFFFFFFFCGSCAEVWISFALANGNFQSVDCDQSCLINGLNRTEPKNEKKNSIELNGWGKFMWALCSACADTINDGVTCFRLSTRFPHSLHSFGLCLIHARDIDICMK
jgi:hypothetical protein